MIDPSRCSINIPARREESPPLREVTGTRPSEKASGMLIGHEFTNDFAGIIPAVVPNPGPGTDPKTVRVPDLQAIYKEYFNFVWSTARHLGATADAIDDVVQDVFMVVHSKLSTLQRPESLRSWIYGIIRRTLSDYRRARRIRNAAEAKLGAEIKSNQPSHASPLENTERNAGLELLQRILSELDDPKREIFIMVEILEMTVPEVVQVLAIPLDTGYSRLRKARLYFDEALARHEAQNEKNRQVGQT